MSIVRFRGTAEVPEQFDAVAMTRQYVPMFDEAGMFEFGDGGAPKEFLLGLFTKKDACAPLKINGLDIPVFSNVGMAYFTGGGTFHCLMRSRARRLYFSLRCCLTAMMSGLSFMTH